MEPFCFAIYFSKWTLHAHKHFLHKNKNNISTMKFELDKSTG